ncbi:MAG: hypothetical protein MJK04_32010 [Psychrosphaera sp.]|nr:hypothetical protein [Psychrosphaera sp.]
MNDFTALLLKDITLVVERNEEQELAQQNPTTVKSLGATQVASILSSSAHSTTDLAHISHFGLC